jgi:hypothetical protein
MESIALDAAGHRRSPATMPGYQSAEGRAGCVARSAWIAGPGNSSTPGCSSDPPCQSARCCLRSTARPQGGTGNARRLANSSTTPRRSRASGAASPPPAPSRPRDRDGPRGHPTCCYPAPTRACEPRDHVRLPPRDRQLRDHRNRPLTSSTDDQRHSGPRASVAETGRREAHGPRRHPSAGE